jgi:GntR family transcriptional regulator, carbon starvation induced regulator
MACGSRWLLHFLETIPDHRARYRRLSVSYASADPDVQGGFRKLVDAVLARDADRACGLLNDSIARTAEVILANTPGLDPGSRAP